jgi:tetratricopeptide (TPR) repeat protein
MNKTFLGLTLIAFSFPVLASDGWLKYEATAESAGVFSEPEAVEIVESFLNHCEIRVDPYTKRKAYQTVKVYSDRIEAVYIPARWEKITGDETKTFRFKDIQSVGLTYKHNFTEPDEIWISYKKIADQTKPDSIANCAESKGSLWLGDAAKKIPDAIMRLKMAYDAENGSDADAKFQEIAAAYRSANPKPTLSEEAHKLKVQAEFAVQQKRFSEAADYYAEALKLVPWWPAGYFNRALLLGESASYEDAIREMKHFLVLSPDSPDARAAQDKIYQWESLFPKQDDNPHEIQN